MSEAAALVTWDTPEVLGEIARSEWVCPAAGLEGRLQYLERVRYPEGLDAARIVDSQTGEVRIDPKYSSGIRYVFNGKSVDFGEGRQLAFVDILHDGTRATIAEARPYRPLSLRGPRTTVDITPQSRKLFMRTEGEVDAIDGYGTLTIQEADANATGELTVWVGKPNVSGQINVELGADGQVTKLAAYKRDLVDRLGVAIESNFNPNTNWVKIDDPAQQVIALNGLSEMLGLGQWRGLDLRLTASGLYAAMGHRDFDPFGALVPQK